MAGALATSALVAGGVTAGVVTGVGVGIAATAAVGYGLSRISDALHY